MIEKTDAFAQSEEVELAGGVSPNFNLKNLAKYQIFSLP